MLDLLTPDPGLKVKTPGLGAKASGLPEKNNFG